MLSERRNNDLIQQTHCVTAVVFTVYDIYLEMNLRDNLTGHASIAENLSKFKLSPDPCEESLS